MQYASHHQGPWKNDTEQAITQTLKRSKKLPRLRRLLTVARPRWKDLTARRANATPARCTRETKLKNK